MKSEFDLNKIIEEKFSIYCAGEFSSLLIQYCAKRDMYDNIIACMVTKKEPHTPAHILGIPVIEFPTYSENKNIPILIAILSSEIGNAIRKELSDQGYKRVYVLDQKVFRMINKCLIDYSADIKNELKRLTVKNDLIALRLEKKIDQLSMQINSMPMVVEAHKKAFDEYKDKYIGKTLVLCGAGSSLNLYKYNPDYVHIGCNSVAFKSDIKLDYYFIQHLPTSVDLHTSNYAKIHSDIREKYIRALYDLDCVKFLGQAIGDEWMISPPIGDYYNDQYRTYYISRDLPGTHYYSKDIRYSFLYGQDSIVFPMMQFALFTNPKRIYLVGFDGYSGKGDYFDKEHDDQVKEMLSESEEEHKKTQNIAIKNRFVELSDFSSVCFPQTEVIMVNPCFFKGIFMEAYTDGDGRIIEERSL